MAKTTFAISFYCRESKMNKRGESPVEMSICLNGKRKFINLPIKYSPSVFNRKRQPQEIVDCLSVWRQRINEYVTDIMQCGQPLTVENLREIIQTGGIRTYTIGNLFEDYLSILRERVGHSLSKDVYKKYELVARRFSDEISFERECSHITNYVIRKFYANINARYDMSTTAGMMTKLKAFITFGIDNDKLKINPFQGIKITKPKKDITYLTEGEIRALSQAKMDNKSLQQVLDCFIVMCGTGLAYSDLKGLKKEDIQEENGTYYIAKKRVKNGQDYTSVILPFAIPVIEKYDCLPVISNQKMNLFLKRIGEVMGIKQSLHCHLARHSYATLLLNKGVSLSTVSKTLGHSNVKITQQHYATLLNNTIINEVAKVF